jgi:hypothetical protein
LPVKRFAKGVGSSHVKVRLLSTPYIIRRLTTEITEATEALVCIEK